MQLKFSYVVQITGKEMILFLKEFCLLNLTLPTYIDTYPHTEYYSIYTQININNIFSKPTKSSRRSI